MVDVNQTQAQSLYALHVTNFEPVHPLKCKHTLKNTRLIGGIVIESINYSLS